MKVNINDHCTVKLTKIGADRLNRESIQFKNAYPNVRAFQDPRMYSEGDEYKCQIWNLMNTFGDLVLLGHYPPFETEIEIEVSDGRE